MIYHQVINMTNDDLPFTDEQTPHNGSGNSSNKNEADEAKSSTDSIDTSDISEVSAASEDFDHFEVDSFLNCMGKDNLLKLHETLVHVYGMKQGQTIYKTIKTNPTLIRLKGSRVKRR